MAVAASQSRKLANKARVFFSLGFIRSQETAYLNPVPFGNTGKIHTCVLAAELVDLFPLAVRICLIPSFLNIVFPLPLGD